MNPDSLDNLNIINMDKAKPIRVHGVIYRSICEASKITNISRRTLVRYLESDKPEHEHVTYVVSEFR